MRRKTLAWQLKLLFFLRWCVKESLTIREASWLTDRTYDYDDVVRMIGELVAVHKGNIRVSCKA